MVTEILIWLLIAAVFFAWKTVKAIDELRESNEKIAAEKALLVDERHKETIEQLEKIAEAIETLETKIDPAFAAPKVQDWEPEWNGKELLCGTRG